MNIIDKKDTALSLTYICALFLVMATATEGPLARLGARMKISLSTCISLVIVAITSWSKRGLFQEKVHIFFADSDKKSVITFSNIILNRLSICANPTEEKGAPYLMFATLDKPVANMRSGGSLKAERKIKLCAYGSSKSNVFSRNPQISICISGKGRKKRMVTWFSYMNGSTYLILDMQLKRYEKYVPIAMLGSEDIRRAIELTIDGKTILQLLLVEYLQGEKLSYQSSAKVLYLLSRFGDMVPKNAKRDLRRFLKKFKQLSIAAEDEYKGVLVNVERSLGFLVGDLCQVGEVHEIAECDFQSMRMDVLVLLRDRVFRYENLHEVLAHAGCAKLVSSGIEEVIACYSETAGYSTSAIIKKNMLEMGGRTAHEVRIVHRYIEECKRSHDGILSSIVERYPGDSGISMEAYDILRSFASCLHTDDLDFIIDAARAMVAAKYRKVLVNSVTGIAERVTASLGRIKTKISKVVESESPLVGVMSSSYHPALHNLLRL